jgi:hypothetical protein
MTIAPSSVSKPSRFINPAATAATGQQGSSNKGLAKLQSSSVDNAEVVVGLVRELETTMDAAVDEIRDINENAKLLALNARIEAARASSNGAAFGVVAEEMQSLSNNTAQAANELANKTKEKISLLVQVIGTNIRGTRLSDIALTNIDLIDRCLYERTCDVRWWATDSSIVDALTQRTPESRQHASQRMGVILNAYTVYFDLVLCDTRGEIVANGRSDRYRVTGRNESSSPWFSGAMASRSGDDFSFQTAHGSPLVGDQSVLVYSCGVREGGQANGRLLGVLGVLFNWSGLAQPILTKPPLSEAERSKTESFIVDQDAKILAASNPQYVGTPWPHELSGLLCGDKGYTTQPFHGRKSCIAHALSPGFETYATGWHSFIVQQW